MNPADARFWSKVAVTPSGCWEWQGWVQNKYGYGGFNVSKTRKASAHRFAYETCVGPIPDGLELDHLCFNPRCVHPLHLEPVTHAENQRRTRGRCHSNTHCPSGHPYDDANTYSPPSRSGWRYCRACHRTHNREYAQRVRAAAKAKASA